TAAELINAYGDLETLLAHAEEIKQPKRREALTENEAKARLSKELVKLDDNVPLPCPLSDLRVAPYDPEKLFPFLDEMELRALKSRIEKRLAITAPAAPVGPAEPVIPEIPSFSMPRTYAVVDTMEGLDHWIEAAEQAGHVALWLAPSLVSGTRPEFCGLALAVSPGLAAYVPLGHRPTELFESGGGLSREDAVARLKPLLEHPGVLKIVHDAKSAAHRRSRADDLARCRARIQHRLAKAIGRRAVREARAPRRQEGQDRRLRHRRVDPRAIVALASRAGAGARVAAAHQAQIDLCRRARRQYRRPYRAGAHLVRAGSDRDGPVLLLRAEYPEHPDPHRG